MPVSSEVYIIGTAARDPAGATGTHNSKLITTFDTSLVITDGTIVLEPPDVPDEVSAAAVAQGNLDEPEASLGTPHSFRIVRIFHFGNHGKR